MKILITNDDGLYAGGIVRLAKAAKEFAIYNKIDKLDKNSLSKIAIELNCSNILVVLSKYLIQK